jgi:hypothetical protein
MFGHFPLADFEISASFGKGYSIFLFNRPDLSPRAGSKMSESTLLVAAIT